MHSAVAYAAAALSAGGSAYVLKSSMGAEILEAIGEALQGPYYVTPSLDRHEVMAQMGQAGRRKGATSEPTPRRREVVQLLDEGKSIKEVAGALNLSSKTVEFHKYKIMKQFGLRNNAELTKYAVKLGITTIE